MTLCAPFSARAVLEVLATYAWLRHIPGCGICLLALRSLATQCYSLCCSLNPNARANASLTAALTPVQIEGDVAHAGRIVTFMGRLCCFRGKDGDAERERCRPDAVQRWVDSCAVQGVELQLCWANSVGGVGKHKCQPALACFDQQARIACFKMPAGSGWRGC